MERLSRSRLTGKSRHREVVCVWDRREEEVVSIEREETDAGAFPYADSRLNGGTLNWRLSMPRLAIFDSRVWCGIPSFAAAPRRPETRPWHSANAASIAFLSRCTNSLLSSVRVPMRGTGRPDSWFDLRGSHVSSTENVSSSHRIKARSTTFCSSRTFPGQS